VAPPFKIAEFDLYYGEGFSLESDLIDLGVKADVVSKTGTWFSYGDVRLGQGKENARQFLLQNPEVRDELNLKLRGHYGIGENAEDAEPAAEPEAEEKSAKAKAREKAGAGK